MAIKRLVLHDDEKLKLVNDETLRIFEKYKVDMAMRNLSPKTQYHYSLDLHQWFIYILDYQDNRSVCELVDEDITEFLYYCKAAGNNAERINSRIACISALYKFMRKRHMITENPVEFIDRPKRGIGVIKQTYMTPEQVALMREKLIQSNNTQLRLYAMISLSTMARVSAVASLRWNQIDFEHKVIHDVLEKESKIVDLYFSDEVKCLLLKLRQEREEKKKEDYGWVFFVGRCGSQSHANTGTLNAWSHKIGRMIGVPSLHPHDFRHSGATLLKNAGMSLEDISTLLSHESLETTKKYYIKENTARLSVLKQIYNI